MTENNLSSLYGDNGSKVDIRNFGEIIKSIISMSSLEGHESVVSKLQEIATSFANLKSDATSKTKVHDAQNLINIEIVKELNSVNVSTTESINQILDLGEKMQKILDDHDEEFDGHPAFYELNSLVGQIFLSCNIQDLNGQRVQNVFSKLDEVDKKLDLLLKFYSVLVPEGIVDVKITNEESLMNGPAAHAATPSQSDIDDLFDSL